MSPLPNLSVLPESLKRFLAKRPGSSLAKIRTEASSRSFYRIRRDRKPLVAMVYPGPAPDEVKRFCSVQRIYREHGLRVPRIREVLGDQVVIQEDAGGLLLQRVWHAGAPRERMRLLEQCREILGRLAAVPPGLAAARLDRARLNWEMDFFIRYFFSHFQVRSLGGKSLRRALERLVASLAAEDTFAHRDFHSRNLLVLGGEIVVVDFQDSLVAPRYYDLVSLAFDSYLDLGPARGRLFPNLAAWGDDRELRQMRLTALQRNIKALGTFAYQTYERRHPAYARYIPRTLHHIRGHLRMLAEPEFSALSKYFNSL
jgi:aminoglycoside/choline kinase family phosphotransferase